jgi:hypothetical protein
MPSRFLDVAAPLSLGLIFRCCIPVAPDISSRTYLLSRFRLQHCPCLVPDDCVLCAVQEWHSGSSICGRRPTSCGITIAMGPSLQLLAALYGQMSVPIPLLKCSDSFHCDFSFTDLLTKYPTVPILLRVNCWVPHVISTQTAHWRTGYCLATAVVSLFVSRSLPSNRSMGHNI